VLAASLTRLRNALVLLPGRLVVRWRGSLQLRVVVTTLVVSAVVVTILVFSLIQQISAGLIKAREQSAGAQAREGLTIAQGQPGLSRPPGSGTHQHMQNLVNTLKSTDQGGAASFGVAVLLPAKAGPPVYSAGEFAGLTPDALRRYAPKLVAQVGRGGCKPAYVNLCVQPAALPFPDPNSPRRPGLAFGAPFGFGNYFQLYYFYPLAQEQATISLVQQTLALAGVALVFLLAAIAAMVTRWVVVPVARAAQSAQRLSTGNLAERLEVRGSDELAALGRSFNEMAQSLQEKVAELEELSAVQRQFVSDVSHELRTPLATIRMAGDLLFEARDQLESSAARSAELLHGQLGRFEALLADLLEISRYDANVATLDAEPADLCDLVRQSADIAQQLAERRGARIEFRLPADPCMAEVDRRRVERILRNLLVNAVEHGEGKDVVVTVAGDRDAVAVAVRDYGVGLGHGEEQLVFDRFWRADPARARSTGGTGLGLAIALEDARLHGGWLEAWGEPGRGSLFRLTLPRTATAALSGSPLALGPDQADLDGATDVPAAAAATGDAVPGLGTVNTDLGGAAGPGAAGHAGTEPDGTLPDVPHTAPGDDSRGQVLPAEGAVARRTADRGAGHG
jgi:two-component system, OmpR family, sensor histidine kinase MtrB